MQAKTAIPDSLELTHIIHEHFYCNRRYAATTSLDAGSRIQTGSLSAQSVNILFQVCLPSSRLRVPISLGVLAASSRTVMNNVGYPVRTTPI